MVVAADDLVAAVEDLVGTVVIILAPAALPKKDFVLLSTIMYLTTDRKEQQTRCIQPGRRSYSMWVQPTGRIFATNYKTKQPSPLPNQLIHRKYWTAMQHTWH